jgi:hypothetical protein
LHVIDAALRSPTDFPPHQIYDFILELRFLDGDVYVRPKAVIALRLKETRARLELPRLSGVFLQLGL